MSNTIDKTVFTKLVSATATEGTVTFPWIANEIHLIADGDCLINFDGEVADTERFLLKANTEMDTHESAVSTFHYKTTGATVNIYIMAFAKQYGR